MLKPLKAPTSYAEQVQLLKDRGMIIEDERHAYDVLRQINYYRLSAYWFHFLEPKTPTNQNNVFKPGTSFNKVIGLYDFDRALRLILIEALERIEVIYRAEISYYFSQRYRENGHYDAANFWRQDWHDEFLLTLKKQMEKNEDAPFVKHHITKYNGKMPLWCAFEVLSFSDLSKFYHNLKRKDQKNIAQNMGHDASYLHNWLHCMSILRNKCAHYARLYNMDFSLPAKIGAKTLKKYQDMTNNSLFSYIVTLQRLLISDEEATDFRGRLASVFTTFDGQFEPSRIGLPENWAECLQDPILIGRGKTTVCILP